LAQAVEQVRHPRNHATVRLTPHREELLRLHRAGDSPETLALGLRLLGIEIGRETMRRWLDRELGRKPAKRRKRAANAAANQAPSADSAGNLPAGAKDSPMPPA
jgi:transposase